MSPAVLLSGPRVPRRDAGAGPRRHRVRSLRTRGRFLAAGLGTRMLALIFALLALWAVVSLVLLNRALVQRLDSRVDEELAEEIRDFGGLASDQLPASGRFNGAGLERLFDTMVARNMVGDSESVLTFNGSSRPGRSAQGRSTSATRRGPPEPKGWVVNAAYVH